MTLYRLADVDGNVISGPMAVADIVDYVFAIETADDAAPPEQCGAVYTSNTLGGLDVCARPAAHDGRHDWRGDR